MTVFTRTAQRTAKSIVRAASFVVVSALGSTAALAATAGSTDIYANDFAASFSHSGAASPSPSASVSYNGSTDLWAANGVRASFGQPGLERQPAQACGVGSTDVWGVEGFRASFSPKPTDASIEMAQTCQRVLR